MTIKKHILLEGKKSVNGLEVSDNLGLMSWHESIVACKSLGPEWRFPTKDELNMLHENKEEIGGFANLSYWSSTEYDTNDAWLQYFGNGYQSYGNKSSALYVRAVRYS